MKRAFVGSALLPAYDRESGSRRLHHLVEILLAQGWTVTFAARDDRDGQRYVDALRQKGVKVLPDLEGCDERFFASQSFDLALVSFWYVAEQLAPMIRDGSPGTRLVVDTVDVHFLRMARHRALQGTATPFDPGLVDEMARELNTYAGSDGVLVVSQKEADLLDDLLGGVVAVRAVPDCEEIDASPVPIADRHGLLFVGNFGHTPNLDAVDLLCDEVVPLLSPELLRRHPVRIVGNGRLPRASELAARPGIDVVGWVPDLLPYLHRSRAAVAPLQWGAGTKRKMIQYLMSGTPTVATAIAAEGLELGAGKHFLRAEDPAAMAAAIETLVEDDALSARLAAEGRRHVLARHGRVHTAAALADLVEEVLTAPRRVAEPPASAREKLRYEADVAEITTWIQSSLPASARVAVVSKGDPKLVDLGVDRTWHFPCTSDGGYAGHHPADEDDAVTRLDELRLDGLTHLVLPRVHDWWKEQYPRLFDSLIQLDDEHPRATIFRPAPQPAHG